MQSFSHQNDPGPGVFITGASGFIGKQLAITLANQGFRVHALVRSTSLLAELTHHNITLFNGDLLDKASIVSAMENCQQVYHLGGLAKAWMPDKASYYNVNVTGTRNVLEAAKSFAVKK